MPRHAVKSEVQIGKPSKGVVALFAILVIVVISAATGWGW